MKGSLKWFASGGGIAQAGPFDNQWDAFKAFRLTDTAQQRQRQQTGSNSPYPVDLVVWPEQAGASTRARRA